jgi:hypothetical protein
MPQNTRKLADIIDYENTEQQYLESKLPQTD